MIPRTRSAWSIHHIILLLLGSVLAPVLFIQAWIYLDQFRIQRNDALQANLELARAVASAFDGYVHHILTQELIIGSGLAANPDPEHARRILNAAARANPTILRFNWLDPKGKVVMSSDPRAINLQLAFRPFVPQIVAGKQTVVSDLYQARLAKEPVFAIVRGIRDDNGHLRGMVVGLVDTTRLDQVLALQRVGDGSLVISDSQGCVVYRHPKRPMSWEERQPRRSEVLRRTLAGEEVKGILPSRFDGLTRMGCSAPVHSIHWAIAATRPVNSVMGPVANRLYRDFGLLLLVTTVAFIFALYLGRAIAIPIDLLRAHTHLVGKGLLTREAPRVGPRELRELTDSFNEMTRQLQTRDDEREVYIQAISHDLRNPLTIIHGNAEFLQRMLSSSSEFTHARASASAILAAAQRITAMSRDLLDFAHLETDRFVTEPVSLQHMVPALFERYRVLFPMERLCLDLPSDLPMVVAHGERLERILLNLMTNAVKYSTPGTPIRVSARQQDAMVEIAIANQGDGIEPDDLPHIFNRFYRAQHSQHADGLGLGLYIARMLIEAHRGHIRVESAPGAGCTFYFTLPCA